MRIRTLLSPTLAVGVALLAACVDPDTAPTTGTRDVPALGIAVDGGRDDDIVAG